jgi:hypothetical protein
MYTGDSLYFFKWYLHGDIFINMYEWYEDLQVLML